ncbi:hypothetical protein U9M48_018210 [Paspalum notatum var. saurae]|uniref:protein-serine/threonine phosphatase n=1 Tax=Paspalum notatum var. saurae TaxID=547442 RepID=A0AAQ3TCX8_PASNO
MSSGGGEAGTQDHDGVPAAAGEEKRTLDVGQLSRLVRRRTLELRSLRLGGSGTATAEDEEMGGGAGEAGTQDHGGVPVPAAGEGEEKWLVDVARLRRLARRRRRLELRSLSLGGAAEGEAAKRVRSAVPATSSDSSPESAKVAPAPQLQGPLSGGRWPKCLSHGAVSVIGRRRKMEDAVAVVSPFLVAAPAGEDEDGGGGDLEFFAVYDGHGGVLVADICKERIQAVLAEELARLRLGQRGGGEDENEGARWREAMEACFARVDGEVSVMQMEMERRNKEEHKVGATAVVAVVSPRSIVVANCGDSRAVLCRGGVPVPLSDDHKPERPDETERVEAAGGYVIHWNGCRVWGLLSTSRAIGDQYMKPFISAEPEVTVTARTDKDEFLILASDGLWDVVPNDVACRVARNCLSGRLAAKHPLKYPGTSASDAAALLVELAMSKGSEDNVSVVVAELNRTKWVPRAARRAGHAHNGRT